MTTRLQNAGSFSFRWLRHNPQHSVPVSLLALYLGVWLMAPHHKTTAAPPAIAAAPAAPAKLPQVKPKSDKEQLSDTRIIHEGQNIWRMEIWGPKKENESDYYLEFYRNSQLVKTVRADDMSGHQLDFAAIRFKTSGPLIAVEASGLCCPRPQKWLYTFQQGRIVQMLAIGTDYGGPIFRGKNGAEASEWVFDDFKLYEAEDAGPKHFLIYKQAKNGELKLWKQTPNVRHRRLPYNLGDGR